MKVNCKKQNLSDAVLNIQSVVSTKSPIPALEGILVKTKDSMIELCGYDLELGVTTLIDADIEEPGSIVLNAKLFCDIVRKIQAENISIKTDDKLVTEITGGESKFSISGITPDEYPELPEINETSSFSIPQNTLKSMIRQTIFAISDNDAKPIHTGTLFEITEDKMRLVSVDGYRLAIREEPLKAGIKSSFVVPGKTLKEIMKLLGDGDDETQIKIGTRHILYNIGSYTVISRLLEGEFLDYRAAIPQKAETTVKVGVNEMTDSVSRISLIITERLKSPVRCIFGENEIKLFSTSSIGKASDHLKAEISGSAVEIGFNNSYFLDAMNHTECDEVKISLCGPLSPIKITPPDGESFIFLVLPVRLNNMSD
ncbi:MAG TPA: DNA polymerase III subunit beta [Ruminococcaceae bacterium]|nr:DNA polymerase III subunit beta [Oscillospiraceae bacterium]